jgi:DMSO reductase anchor subunit
LASEWPLLLFSLLAAVLVGLMAAPGAHDRLQPLAFLALAATAMGASTFHLGRKHLAWRAVLNWRGSWLSREIILFSAFTAMSFLHLVFGERAPVLDAAASVVGLAALFAIDKVYEVTRTPGLHLHSARTISTGVLVASLASGAMGIAVFVLALKLVLYLHRHMATEVARVPAWIAVIRVTAGMVVPGWMWWTGHGLGALGLAGLAAGEILDRVEFYLEIDVPTPRRQIARDLAAALSQRPA